MSNWIRTGNFEEYRKAGLLSPDQKQVLLFFEQVEDPEFQHALGYFNFQTGNWLLSESGRVCLVSPSHFQLLTTPTQ